jgi:hypothetical protein
MALPSANGLIRAAPLRHLFSVMVLCLPLKAKKERIKNQGEGIYFLAINHLLKTGCSCDGIQQVSEGAQTRFLSDLSQYARFEGNSAQTAEKADSSLRKKQILRFAQNDKHPRMTNIRE